MKPLLDKLLPIANRVNNARWPCSVITPRLRSLIQKRAVKDALGGAEGGRDVGAGIGQRVRARPERGGAGDFELEGVGIHNLAGNSATARRQSLSHCQRLSSDSR